MSSVSKFSTVVKMAMTKMVMTFVFVCGQVQHGGEDGDDVCPCV